MNKTKRTPELCEEILERMSEGEPLRQILRSGPHMPHASVWNDWCIADPDLKKRHQQARDDGYDAIALDALRIADTPVEGIETTEKATGKEVRTGDMLGHRRLQVETRLKLLAKWDPRRYGDKLALGGADDLPPLRAMTDEQLAERVRALQERVRAEQA